MNKPHKHAELIKAWADGAKIEFKREDGWYECKYPIWYEEYEYRIKPKPPKPDVVNTLCLTYFRGGIDDMSLVELTFDGETGKLKAAEVLQ